MLWLIRNNGEKIYIFTKKEETKEVDKDSTTYSVALFSE
jgi:hypothetical protein